MQLIALITFVIALVLYALTVTQETGMLRSSRLRLQLFCNQLTPALSAQEAFNANLRRVWGTLTLLRVIALALMVINAAFLAAAQIEAYPLGFAGLVLALALVIILGVGEVVPRWLARRWPDRALNLCSPLLRLQQTLLGTAASLIFRHDPPYDPEGDDPAPLPASASPAAHLMVTAPQFDSPQTSVSPVPELGDDVFSAALDFNRIRVNEFMVPRTEIVAFSLDGSVSSLRQKFIETKLSRIVITRDSLDDLVGLVHSSSLLEAEKPPTSLAPLIQPLFVVPESLPANQLLREFNRHRRSIAAVVDEFGGTAGLVTLEDLVEVIVGEIEDEYDEPKDPSRVEEPLGPHSWRFSARLEVEYLNRTYDLDLPEGEYTTLAGYVLHLAERIPEPNEVLATAHLKFTVLSADANRLNLIRVDRVLPSSPSA